MPIPQKSTLCWECQNAVPNSDGTRGCNWSRWFVPVDGWVAIPTVKGATTSANEKYGVASYKVIDCPEFIADPPRGKKDED